MLFIEEKQALPPKSNGCQAYLLVNAIRANRKIEKYSTTLNFSLSELGICARYVF